MKSIIWKEYLKKDGLNICSWEGLEKEENEIGFTLFETLKQMMMKHGGQSPENLLPKFPRGKSMSIECLYHA
ncbi:hypothetical protein [Thalassomonas haliotis]|uniref:Uncharacterized protein n=1 Tax=Thalassomonas haliotis TaxID=485448 RepID=A0ABY7VM36_9GAMM|nr:hypothetical protein [Thalassomonas haliotis]WDE13722.1 hypothetical protein H3N35_09960 [Thalassomonas haliotis]